MILTVCSIQWWLLCLCKPCWQSETSYCCVWKFYVHSCMIIITSVLSMITLVLSVHDVQKSGKRGVEKNFFSREVIVKNQLSVAIFNLCLFRSLFKLYKIIHSSLKLTWLLVKDFFLLYVFLFYCWHKTCFPSSSHLLSELCFAEVSILSLILQKPKYTFSIIAPFNCLYWYFIFCFSLFIFTMLFHINV